MSAPLIAALNPTFTVPCPRCATALVHDDVVFAGLPILVHSRCPECLGTYLLDWPAGHALLHPTIVDLGSHALHYSGSEWYPRALERLLETRTAAREVDPTLRTRPPAHATAVVVNCIDYVYGHCLLKLLSGLHYTRDGGVDVVVIAPRQVSWLLPDSVHTLIELDLPLKEGRGWLSGLDETVKGVLAQYAEVVIAPAPSQPRLTAEDLALTAPGLSPGAFWEAEEDGPPQVTLLLREDRLWAPRPRRTSLGGRLRLPRRLRHRLGVAAQNRRFAQVVRAVQASVPEARFVAVGLGCTGRLPAAVRDLRRAVIEPGDELGWCGEYARSRVVVGVHGSHLLLPSALGGAVVDLLPPHKLPNIAQDLIIANDSESEPKLCLFRYRILPTQTDARTVAETIVSLLRDADRHHLNMVRNLEATGSDWPRSFRWRPLDREARGDHGGRVAAPAAPSPRPVRVRSGEGEREWVAGRL